MLDSSFLSYESHNFSGILYFKPKISLAEDFAASVFVASVVVASALGVSVFVASVFAV